MVDYCGPEWIDFVLTQNAPVSIYLDEIEGEVTSWFVTWRDGTMSLQGGDAATARATAAMFIYLYDCGLQCDLARDLACAYFDPRIGRTVTSR